MILGTAKVEGKTTLIKLYDWDTRNRVVSIGVNNHRPMQRPMRTNEKGDYVVHGYTKFYLEDFNVSPEGMLEIRHREALDYAMGYYGQE